MTEPLSPAAQAILAAFNDRYELYWEQNWREACLAAALRALADAVVPDVGAFLSPGTAGDIRDHILSITTELESTND